jgi:hypothetical protein
MERRAAIPCETAMVSKEFAASADNYMVYSQQKERRTRVIHHTILFIRRKDSP